MSGGGRVQLSAVGIQDVLLTENPEMSYFIRNYKRHTQFALQTAEVEFQQEAKFGGKVRTILPRMGDLIREISVRVTLPEIDQNLIQEFSAATQTQVPVATYPTYCDSVGHALIRRADLVIGGQTIESINGDYMDIYEDMFVPKSHSLAIQQMVGRNYSRTGMGPASNVAYRTDNGFDANGSFPRTFIIPLRFWYTQDPNLSIPLVAINRQEVEIALDIEEIERLVVSSNYSVSQYLKSTAQLGGTPLKIKNMTLLVDYVNLTDEEASVFIDNSFDYLITQIQGVETFANNTDNFTEIPKQIRTNFNNPVKEIYMIIQDDNKRPRNLATATTLLNDYFNYKSPSNEDNLKKLELLFNGECRISPDVADSFYLRTVQPMQCHTKIPERYTYCYSFSLDPENYAPTGQVNMSRIKDTLFNVYLNPVQNQSKQIRIYVKNYNVLRIQGGLAGVLFNFSG